MCGRYTLTREDLLKEWSQLDNLQFQTSYNIAPGSMIPVVTQDQPLLQISEMKWGFEFSNNSTGSKQLIINARGETLNEKPTFKKPLKENRCLIPAIGFYEWQRSENNKIPYFIALKDQPLFYFGGLYRTEQREGKSILKCLIITTTPNQIMEPIHNRMPFIVPKDKQQQWLTAEAEQAQTLISPYPADLMFARTVSKEVNKPANDRRELIEEFEYKL